MGDKGSISSCRIMRIKLIQIGNECRKATKSNSEMWESFFPIGCDHVGGAFAPISGGGGIPNKIRPIPMPPSRSSSYREWSSLLHIVITSRMVPFRDAELMSALHLLFLALLVSGTDLFHLVWPIPLLLHWLTTFRCQWYCVWLLLRQRRYAALYPVYPAHGFKPGGYWQALRRLHIDNGRHHYRGQLYRIFLPL